MVVCTPSPLEKRTSQVRIDDYVSVQEIRLISSLEGKSRMEQDEILGELENG